MRGDYSNLTLDQVFTKLENTLGDIQSFASSLQALKGMCLGDGMAHAGPLEFLAADDLSELWHTLGGHIKLLADSCLCDMLYLAREIDKEKHEVAESRTQPSAPPVVDLGKLAEIILVGGRRFVAMETTGEAAAVVAARAGFEVFQDGVRFAPGEHVFQPTA